MALLRQFNSLPSRAGSTRGRVPLEKADRLDRVALDCVRGELALPAEAAGELVRRDVVALPDERARFSADLGRHDFGERERDDVISADEIFEIGELHLVPVNRSETERRDVAD